MHTTSRVLTVGLLVLALFGCGRALTPDISQPGQGVDLDGTWAFTLAPNPSWGAECTGDLQNRTPPTCARFVADIAQADGVFQAVRLRVPDGYDTCTVHSLSGTVSGDRLSGVMRYSGARGTTRRERPGSMELVFSGSAHAGSAQPYLYLMPGRVQVEGTSDACSLPTYLYTGRPVS